MMSSDSLKRSRDSSMGIRMPVYSRRPRPRPNPTFSSRPLSMWSSAMYPSATFTGSCHGSTTIIVPMPMRSVQPAKYARNCVGLFTIVYGVKWCSTVHSESKPNCSTSRPSRNCSW